ncbi:porin [Undibacterium parvum]|uniref:Porin n=1 Tax=Undibacterium parvum TaxID=401471 RepID=A0A3S9HGX1_9BURK|nr:porin [Undibacterium parvum]AZP11364.1 porin [Undibacterium parvum]
MKKSLIALAVLSAVAGAAQAQSSVTVYGLVDMGLQRQEIGATKAHGNTPATASSTTTALDSGNQSGSRLGFKGSEDLGGGLKANFKLEMGVFADTGASQGNTFGRQAYVGLSGDFGAVNFGRQYTPMFIAVDSFDPFGTGLTSGAAGESTSSFGAAAFFEPNVVGPRKNNSVTYSTNDLGGFTANLMYGLGEEKAGDNKSSRYMSMSAAYTAGPLFVTGVYSESEKGTNVPYTTKTSLFAATYDFSVVKLAGAYSYLKNDGTPSDALKRDVYSIGATVPVSAAGSFIFNYITSKNKNRTLLTNPKPVGPAPQTLADADANQTAIGYTHSLSKRTNVYTSFSYNRNNTDVSMGDAGGKARPDGATIKMFNVGIRHMF